MIEIPHKDFPGAEKLSPMEMNKIPFDTGFRTDIPAAGTDPINGGTSAHSSAPTKR